MGADPESRWTLTMPVAWPVPLVGANDIGVIGTVEMLTIGGMVTQDGVGRLLERAWPLAPEARKVVLSGVGIIDSLSVIVYPAGSGRVPAAFDCPLTIRLDG
jgi:hypothetical protein